MSDRADNIKSFSAVQYAVLAAVVLLFSTLIAGLSIWSDTLTARKKFDDDVLRVDHFLTQRMASLEAALVSLVGVQHSSDDMENADFAGFSQEILTAYPYISSILLADKILFEETDSYIAEMEDKGFVNFRLKKIEADTNIAPAWLNAALPISFIEPLTPVSAKALGFNLASSRKVLGAINYAVSTGNISASSEITLTQANSKDFLLLKAIFLGRYPPETAEERRNMLTGIVALVMKPEMFFSGIPFDEHHMTVYIQEQKTNTSSAQQELLSGNGHLNQDHRHWGLFELESQLSMPAFGKKLIINLDRDLGLNEINIWKLAAALLFQFIFIFLIFAVYRTRFTARQQEKLAAEIILEEGKRYTQVIDTAFDAVITTDKEGKILSWNQKAEKIFGYSENQVLGLLFLPLILSSESIKKYKEFLTDFFDASKPNSPDFLIEVIGRHQSGNEFPLELSASIAQVGATHILSVFARDISDRKSAEEKIHQLAYFDPLTNLPNRESFKIQADLAIKSAIRNNRIGAVLFIDLDEFKRINDTLGHSHGDLLIQKVAQRLLELVRKNDSVTHQPTQSMPTQNVARLGGDEFTVLLTEISDKNDAGIVARRIQQHIDQSFNLNGHEVYVTPSIGVAVFPHDGKEVNELLKNADTAMYHAKAVGKNNFQFYSEHMSANAAEHLKLEGKLRRALSRNEMKLYYQPQVSSLTGKIIGAEALLRWEQTELGMISPAEFIPLAENTGMILEIGDWVLEQACLQNARWQQAGLPAIRVAVNLSSLQFSQRDLAWKVEQALHKSHLDSKYLELEITESIIMRNIDETIATLQLLRDMNLGISIDDFGTGYSSLSYLKRFPLESLKIDRSFIMDIPNDDDDVKITTAILAMAKSLNLKVTAEGVETEEQAAFLTRQNCELLQGYLYSKPVPAEEFEKLLASEIQFKPPGARLQQTR